MQLLASRGLAMIWQRAFAIWSSHTFWEGQNRMLVWSGQIHRQRRGRILAKRAVQSTSEFEHCRNSSLIDSMQGLSNSLLRDRFLIIIWNFYEADGLKPSDINQASRFETTAVNDKATAMITSLWKSWNWQPKTEAIRPRPVPQTLGQYHSLQGIGSKT